jgi:hypothetical protein
MSQELDDRASTNRAAGVLLIELVLRYARGKLGRRLWPVSDGIHSFHK